MKPCLFLLTCLLPFTTFGQTLTQNTDTSVKQIEAVVDAFRTAILTKNKSQFVQLILQNGISWQSVKGDEMLQRVRLTQPLAVKVDIDPKRNYLSFIDSIVASTERQEEKFWNIKIETDGDIASVFFDYSFHIGDRENNHGKEAWHLVKTDAGWRIASVVYSFHRKPKPEK